MSRPYTYTDRDISWLSFNYRVLCEGMNPEVPLYDRIKFLAIYSSNLDEFFRVRIANLLRIAKIDKPKLEKQLQISPQQLLNDLQQIINAQLDEYGNYLRNVLFKELKSHGIILHANKAMPKKYKLAYQHYFRTKVAAYLQPVIIDEQATAKYELANRNLYLAVRLIDQFGNKKSGFVNIPSDQIPRFHQLKIDDGKHTFVFLDDIIKSNLDEVFPGCEVLECIAIKLNRDADLNIEDEYSGDLVEKLRKQLGKRQIGPPSRFLYDRSVSKSLLKKLKTAFGLIDEECVPGGSYHNLYDLIGFPNPLSPKFQESSLPGIQNNEIQQKEKLYDLIAQKDVLFHFPYHDFDHVLRLFNEAAIDPHIKKIKVTFYRIAKRSIIANALISAAKNGKQVVVFMEVKARFDEENNLYWANKMEEAGITIIYSMPGLKVHAKIALFERQNDDQKTTRYAYLGTGNLNEDTARIYTDHGLMTADKKITSELNTLFKYLHKRKPVEDFDQLLISQFGLRERFIDLIDREIANAQEGKAAAITLKMNNLEHQQMIDKLYEAHNAGVDVTLIIRGICCLQPNVKGQSNKMRVIRLVDRFLEHSRVFVFENDGKPQVFVGSADWMTRNLEHRIEVVFPIKNSALKKEMLEYLEIQISDTEKLVTLNEMHEHKPANSVATVPHRAQMEIYEWVQERENQRLNLPEIVGQNK